MENKNEILIFETVAVVSKELAKKIDDLVIQCWEQGHKYLCIKSIIETERESAITIAIHYCFTDYFPAPMLKSLYRVIDVSILTEEDIKNYKNKIGAN